MSKTTHVAFAAVVCLIAFAEPAAAQPHAYITAVLDDSTQYDDEQLQHRAARPGKGAVKG